MSHDVRGTREYEEVAGYLRRVHEPAFGRPHAVSDPDVTADGSRVVVTGSVYDELAGKPRTALYAAGDGRFTAVTAGPGSARGGRFSPDGESLAFLSDRAAAGVFQLYVLDGARFGEATAAPAAPGTVEYAHWSPDGRHILLGVAGLGADLAGGQGSGTNVGVEDERPAWHPMIDDGVADSAWRTLWRYSLDTGELSRLSPDGLNCWEAAWCGPSAVLAVTSDGPGEDAWYGAVLTHLDVATATTRELLRSGVQLGLPAGSPDGRRAAVVQGTLSDRGIVVGDVVVVDVESGDHTTLDIAGTDATWLQWIDPARLGYVGQRHLDSVAGIAEVGKDVAEVFSTTMSCGPDRYPAGAFTADGRVVVVRSAYRVPPQVAIVGAGTDEVLASAAHPGTDHVRATAGDAQAITWTAPDGLTVEGFVCTPPGDGPFPLVVHIHGGPVSAFRDAWPARVAYVPLLVSRGYAVFQPNPRGSGGRGQDFVRKVIGDMGGADAYDILSGIDALVDRGIADPDRIGLIGGSYGGFMSSRLVTLDQRFAAAVPTAPVTDWYSMTFTCNIGGWAVSFLDADPERPDTTFHSRSPVLGASRVRTPCLTVAGALDRCTPPGQAQEFHQALRAHGVESVLAIYPEEGHGVKAFPALTDFLTRVVMWFERHMPPGPPAAGT